MYIAADDGVYKLVWIVIVGVIVAVSRLVEYFRKQQEEQKKKDARNAQKQDEPKPTSEVQQASGLESLLKSLEQGTVRSQPQTAERRETREENEFSRDVAHAENRDVDDDLEGDGVPYPDEAESARASHSERGLRDKAKLRRAQERIARQGREAREAELAAELPDRSADAAIASSEAGASMSSRAPQTKRAMEAPLATAFAANDLKAGIIWATVLGRPRGASPHGEGQMGSPPGLM